MVDGNDGDDSSANPASPRIVKDAAQRNQTANDGIDMTAASATTPNQQYQQAEKQEVLKRQMLSLMQQQMQQQQLQQQQQQQPNMMAAQQLTEGANNMAQPQPAQQRQSQLYQLLQSQSLGNIDTCASNNTNNNNSDVYLQNRQRQQILQAPPLHVLNGGAGNQQSFVLQGLAALRSAQALRAQQVASALQQDASLFAQRLQLQQQLLAQQGGQIQAANTTSTGANQLLFALLGATSNNPPQQAQSPQSLVGSNGLLLAAAAAASGTGCPNPPPGPTSLLYPVTSTTTTTSVASSNVTASQQSTTSMSICLPVGFEYDKEQLSAFQCLLRKQIEFFTANEQEVEMYTRGRTKRIAPDQVGIRCIHCKSCPPNRRGKGSVYFPSRLIFLYQAAQNLATSHILESCPAIPKELKHYLEGLRTQKVAAGGGKTYWAEAAKILGMVDTDAGIKYTQGDGMVPRQQGTRFRS